VAYVLRGSPDAVIEVDDLPTQPCAGVVGARRGDRIAIAVDGLALESRIKVNMVAWINSVPPPGFGPGSISKRTPSPSTRCLHCSDKRCPKRLRPLSTAGLDFGPVA
jgi:hypothetical protein